jgi:hypothetical protein
MKDLAATATGETTATIERTFALLADLEGYPRWYPSGILAAEVLERDSGGAVTKVKTTLHAAVGPLVRDFRLHLAVSTEEPQRVTLERLPKDPRDREEMEVSWRLAVTPGGTRVTVELRARLSIPPLLPVGGVADGIARGFLNAALAALG